MLQAHFRYVIKFKNFTFTLSFAKKMQSISQTQVDELTSGVLVREDPAPLPEDITLSTECKNFAIISIFEQVPIYVFFSAMLFSGKSNAIYLTREYYQEYGCPFDLYYYPFDTQVCQKLCTQFTQYLPILSGNIQLCEMVFEVQGKTDNYVKLSKDTEPGIEFLSSRKLIEYEIQMEALGN